MYIQTMIQRVKDKTQNAVHTYSRKIPLTNIKYTCATCVCAHSMSLQISTRFLHTYIHVHPGTFGRHSSHTAL